MEDYIDVKKFENDINEKKLEEVYQEIVKRAVKLIKKVARKKKIALVEKGDNTDIFYDIMFEFEKQSVAFQSVADLMEEFLRWDIDPEDDFGETKQQKLIKYIRTYNRIVAQLERYEKTEKEIEEKGFEILEKEKIDKLIELFKEMLAYKSKNYKNDWKFEEWIDNIDMHYHFFHEILNETLYKVKFGYILRENQIGNYNEIAVSDVEKIMGLIDLYKCLADENDGYKTYADFYKEIELKEGQTYVDLYNLEIEKFITLFKEMLEFVDAKYNSEDFEQLSYLVGKYYPYYNEIFVGLKASMWNPSETYISLLDRMETIYENLSKNYRKRNEYLKEYQKEVEEEKSKRNSNGNKE